MKISNSILRTVLMLATAVFFLASGSAQAVEGGRSLYLLGKRGPMAGLIPKPGVYITNDVYHYSGSTDQKLPIAGIVSQNVTADATSNLLQTTWITDTELQDARLALGLLIPYSHVRVGAQGSATYAGTPVNAELSDKVSAFGDPVIAASLGWRRPDGDKLRAWSLYGSLFVPVGSYEEGRLANAGANRWGLDVGTAFSGGNKKRGREFSSVFGVTFNGENLDTEYKSGIEAHLELTYKQHLPSGWSAGLVGFAYQQLTADSNGPSILGDFKGRVFAFGPEVGYQFKAGDTPIGLDLRWYHEFDAKNRVEGDGVFLTLSVGL